MSKKGSAAISTRVYGTFRGADFATDPTLVDYTRSPHCTNMISDGGGMPEKRLGWRVIDRKEGKVNGIYSGTFNGVLKKLVHIGTEVFLFTDEGIGARVATGLPDAKSRCVYLQEKLWIVTGGGYYSYDGTTFKKVSEGDCYVPLILITKQPGGGGTRYEDVNMLTPRRQESFQTDGTEKTFVLSGAADAGTVVKAWVWDEETTAFTLNAARDAVTFTTAPRAPSAGSADGVIIEYSHTVEGYTARIDKCTIISTYGVGTDDRVVLSGNSEMKNVDWISGYADPTYIPDLGYSVVGNDETAIMGYLRSGQYQVIVKEDNGQDASVYLRSGMLDEAGNGIFTVRQSMSGVGAISKGAINILEDDPLFLTRTGVRGIYTVSTTSEKVSVGRSGFVDPQLLRETGLRESESAIWDGLYLLCVNSHVYALDAKRNMSYREGSHYNYECFYWENVPARVIKCVKNGQDEELYFGTEDGRLCKFNSDIGNMTKFSDEGDKDCVGGKAIRAVWATRYDDDGTPGVTKQLMKRGCCVTMKPYARSSGEVYFRTDRTAGAEKRAAGSSMEFFFFGDIDFDNLAFKTDNGPQEIFLNRKVKKYKRLQLMVVNDKVNEGFGIYQITKFYVRGNYAKK